MSVVAANKAFYNQTQKYHTTNKVYLEQFKNMQDLIEHSGESVVLNNDNL